MKRTCLLVGTLMILAALCVLAGLASAAGPGNTDLTWTNAATNDAGTKVERHEGACGAGTYVEVTASNVTGHAIAAKDLTTVTGHAYCYRVRLWNNSLLDGSGVVQYSAYSNEFGVAFPLAPPNAAPSAGTAQ